MSIHTLAAQTAAARSDRHGQADAALSVRLQLRRLMRRLRSRWLRRPDPVSTPHESYRAKLPACTPEGDATILIITRQDGLKIGRVWLSLHSAWRGKACFTDAETDQRRTLLNAAKAARPRPLARLPRWTTGPCLGQSDSRVLPRTVRPPRRAAHDWHLRDT